MDANQPPYDGSYGSVPPAAPVEQQPWAPPAPSAYEAAPGAFSFQSTDAPAYPAPEEPFTYAAPETPAYAQAPEPVYSAPPVLEPVYAPVAEQAPSYALPEAPAAPVATLPAYQLTEAVPFGMGSTEVAVPEQGTADPSEKDVYEAQVRLGAEDTSEESGLLTALFRWAPGTSLFRVVGRSSMAPAYWSTPALSITYMCGVLVAPYILPTTPVGSKRTAVGAAPRVLVSSSAWLALT